MLQNTKVSQWLIFHSTISVIFGSSSDTFFFKLLQNHNIKPESDHPAWRSRVHSVSDKNQHTIIVWSILILTFLHKGKQRLKVLFLASHAISKIFIQHSWNRTSLLSQNIKQMWEYKGKQRKVNREGESGGQHESWVTGKVLLTALTLVLFLDLHCFYLTLCFFIECCYFYWQETIDLENRFDFFLSPIGSKDLPAGSLFHIADKIRHHNIFL